MFLLRPRLCSLYLFVQILLSKWHKFTNSRTRQRSQTLIMFLVRRYTRRSDIGERCPRWQSWTSYFDCNLKHCLVVRKMVFLNRRTFNILWKKGALFLLSFLFSCICQLSNQSCVLLNKRRAESWHTSPLRWSRLSWIWLVFKMNPGTFLLVENTDFFFLF